MTSKKSLKVGQWVEVRSKEEILWTLDREGQLEGMPFMPEMFAFVGKRCRVLKTAHKSGDYSKPYPFYTRRLRRTVHLETRCDGGAHDGCQASCLLYWKEDWLKPIGDPEDSESSDIPVLPNRGPDDRPFAKCPENDIRDRTKVRSSEGETPKYMCQMTQIPFATTPLAWWDPRQYLQDYLSGNVNLGRIV